MIAQVASTGKFLEFHDGLTPAYEEHYAMMQGAVGAKFAPNSGIRVMLSDYSEKDKGKSVTQDVLVPCYVFEEMKEICLKNTGTVALIDGVANALSAACNAEAEAAKTNASLVAMLTGVLSGLATVVKNSAEPTKDGKKAADKATEASAKDGEKFSPAAAFGKALKETRAKIAEEQIKKCSSRVVQVPFGVDYQYSQVRVYTNKAKAEGLCECKSLSIVRKSVMTGKDGSPVIGNDGNLVTMKKPWTFNLSVFDAKPLEHDNGTVSYVSSSVKNKVTLTFSASDAEIHKATWSVEHFIEQWERSQLSGFISGAQKRAEQFKKG